MLDPILQQEFYQSTPPPAHCLFLSVFEPDSLTSILTRNRVRQIPKVNLQQPLAKCSTTGFCIQSPNDQLPRAPRIRGRHVFLLQGRPEDQVPPNLGNRRRLEVIADRVKTVDEQF